MSALRRAGEAAVDAGAHPARTGLDDSGSGVKGVGRGSMTITWADVVVSGGGAAGAGVRSARTCRGDIGLGVRDVAAAWGVVHGAWGVGR
ncbi:hypothetical protein ACFYXF_31950 [Streptomyces sp. NPDC002680]|uniref:hypothetical protein n=1 Tax=Streptomyces sp. NPDC002680 TaxID=3364659 RepID=UPI003697DC26